MTRDGGCLCGRVRYRVTGPPLSAAYCHCRICQKAGGSPVTAWATFALAAFAITEGTPVDHRSTPIGIRSLCAACGTQLTFRYAEGPEDIDVTIASLDDPAGLVPDHHIWTSSRIPWFDTADHLPRHAQSGPDARYGRTP